MIVLVAISQWYPPLYHTFGTVKMASHHLLDPRTLSLHCFKEALHSILRPPVWDVAKEKLNVLMYSKQLPKKARLTVIFLQENNYLMWLLVCLCSTKGAIWAGHKLLFMLQNSLAAG